MAMLPTHESSFFWRSELTSKRKQEIINWVNSLSEHDQDLLQDLLQDIQDETMWDTRCEIEYAEDNNY